MKTVVEKINGNVYVYVNTERHFRKIERTLSGERFTYKDLAEECDLSTYPDNCHFVIDGGSNCL